MRFSTWLANWSWGGTFFLLALLVVISRLMGSVMETDLYWHLLMGADIARTGSLTGSYDATFGPHADWVTTQWLGELLGYWWFELFGWGGFVLLRLVGTVAVFSAVAWSVWSVAPRPWRRGSYATWVAAGAALFAMAFVSVQERPQTFSFILLPVLAVWLIRALYVGRWPSWLLVFVFTVVWVNLHGVGLMVAPLLGWVLVARFALVRFGVLEGRQVGFRAGVMAVVAAAVATLVNPLGWGVFERGLAISRSAGPFIIEWARPFPDFFASFIASPLLLALWLSAFWFLSRAGFARRLMWLDAAYLVPLALYAQTANRAVPVAVLLMMPVVAVRAGQALRSVWRRPVRARLPRLALPVAAALTAGGLLAGGVAVANANPLTPEMPERILTGLSEVSGDRKVVSEYGLTGRIQLFTGGNVLTAVDGRADRYSPRQLARFLGMLQAQPGWSEVFDGDYAGTTDVVVLRESGLAGELMNRGWFAVCEDGMTDGSPYVWLTAPGVEGSCGAEGVMPSADFSRVLG